MISIDSNQVVGDNTTALLRADMNHSKDVNEFRLVNTNQ